MASKEFRLEFKGYWRFPNRSGIPSESGVYCVYAAKYNETRKTVSLRELLYIGESTDVNKRLESHEMQENWDASLRTGEVIAFSFAPVPSADRKRVEAALVYKHEPLHNTAHVFEFPYGTTTVNSSGKVALLNTGFTVSESK